MATARTDETRVPSISVLRKALPRTALAVVLALVAGLPAAIEASEPTPTVPLNLEQIREAPLSPRLREITLRAPTLAAPARGLIPGNPAGETKVRVLLPEGYASEVSARYPVLYLFHGGGGNHTDWTVPAEKGDAEGLTKGLPLIVVMPEGGVAGGYADWYNDGALGAPQWKTYHLDQLIPWIDAHFRTVADRGGRAFAGLSMGGGGLRYAAQRPDLIGVTAAFSGDVDILQPASDWNGMGAMVSRLIWGDRKTQEVRWRGANGPDLAKNLENTDVSIFTGDTGAPEGTYILQGSTAVHERLDKFGIAHRFTIYPGMSHSWPNWNRALSEWLPHLMGRFQGYHPDNPLLKNWAAPSRPQLAINPASFSYSTIEPSYALYGWQVRIQRKSLEFSTLEVEDPHNFAVIGSGRATIDTPPIGRPHVAVRALVTHPGRPDLSQTIALKSDASGRVSIPVILGPPNPFQQYSPEALAASNGPNLVKTPFQTFDNSSQFYRANVQLLEE